MEKIRYKIKYKMTQRLDSMHFITVNYNHFACHFPTRCYPVFSHTFRKPPHPPPPLASSWHHGNHNIHQPSWFRNSQWYAAGTTSSNAWSDHYTLDMGGIQMTRTVRNKGHAPVKPRPPIHNVTCQSHTETTSRLLTLFIV